MEREREKGEREREREREMEMYIENDIKGVFKAKCNQQVLSNINGVKTIACTHT